MDGVISDTQKFHAMVESMLLKKFGIEMTPDEITAKYAGVSDNEMFKEIFEQYKIPTPNLKSLVFEKWNLSFFLL